MQKQTAINLVENNISSIYSKDDVINLINDIDEFNGEAVGNAGLTDEQVRALATTIAEAICGHSDTQSLISDYDLSMHYREVEIDGISLDEGNIEDVVKEGIENWIETQNK